MMIATAMDIIDEIAPYANSITPVFIGEALLHPDIYEIIEYAKKAGISVQLDTNATPLDKKRARRLIDSGLDAVKFSFDGPNKEIYENVRVNANFEKTLNNIQGWLYICTGTW